MAGLIEDGVIGDTRTTALVGRNGSIDWACLPRFDSPVAFAGQVGTEEHGFWRMGPVNGPGGRPAPAHRRCYRGDSLVLVGNFPQAVSHVALVDSALRIEALSPDLAVA
ncbi:trehalase-like domain-containing protein [Streptomyces nigrescens]